ncbi:1-deoxyxylulose-5-phosphate synthase YajO-like [Physella acuta]|uniref:1-deoxyxylulose-5-phosphate synthase YajO-like n=1 Tax=Physella acuta TaxID=109671 RepID=UPI0027DBA27B|nr:1-deoxyxylulose-5-phosphate synthase YajO-like [Physella acuta]XP_059165921.1 1-deoxyxylulose-5-phosphate synthase YajO-like [Physella acuta]XP_059165922.1 1-deoxyxylulose-5-phosphate synthase YajO-like [Physella acuta]XP_059165924.1 1-deoxyxylulose-5-phosphate synthase YajO-like [Physella acuta]XP_059165925.1 1-deoxyxylulose-5-phosphate synthase YajO-like [Physella acuta]XP_059165926.1 1-deoxyxylulose-5-phosphate synthase YajO-like [Physella acuta]
MSFPVAAEQKLPYVFLGRSGLKVSNLCLGTMTFGESAESVWRAPGQCDEALSIQILDRFAEWGGNFIDTADVYGQGKSEEFVGKWLEKQTRENFIIATKVGFNMGAKYNINNVGLSRRHITQSIDKSLERLRTSYVDLYQAHIFDDGTPLEETFRTFDDLVRCGKVRYIGASNFTGWQLQKLVDLNEKLGLNPIISLQQQYNLVSRESELEPFQVCKTSGIGVLPWSPLKGGLLSGKVKRGQKPEEGRMAWVAENESRANQAVPAWTRLDDKTFDLIEAGEAIAKKYGRSLAQVAIRWLLQKDVVSSVIIGARNLKQLDDNLGAGNGWSLTKEEMQLLDDLSEIQLPYPYDLVFHVNTDRRNVKVAE